MLDGLRVIPERRTAVAFVAYDAAGGRDFWFSVPDSAAVEVDHAALRALWPRVDWLHVCGSTLGFGGPVAEAIEATAQHVLRAGGQVSLDPNLRPDASPAALARTAELAAVAGVLFPSAGRARGARRRRGRPARARRARVPHARRRRRARGPGR